MKADSAFKDHYPFGLIKRIGEDTNRGRNINNLKKPTE
jgi:hypothetical protein